jgi:hypothetical protein
VLLREGVCEDDTDLDAVVLTEVLGDNVPLPEELSEGVIDSDPLLLRDALAEGDTECDTVVV